MKKLILLLAVSFISVASFAQLPLSLGIHAGTSVNEIKTTGDSFDQENRMGWMVGAFARVNVAKWYVEPALNYTCRESKLENGGKSQTLKTKSWDIPVMIGYKFINLKVVNLRLFAGPEFMFGSDLKFLEDAEKRDVAYNGKVGLGVDATKITLDVDYCFGLSDYKKDAIDNIKCFNFTIGFKIL